MSMIADRLEKFILDQMQREQERVVLRRNDLASELDCAPSQISYVLSTRFSPDRGFEVESRRGLGGYIRIQRIQEPSLEALPVVSPRPIYQSTHYNDRLITLTDVDQSLLELLEEGRLTKREARMMHESFKAMMGHLPQELHNDTVRNLFANMITIMKEER